jgi:membrane protein implicated in regulation of membrane protease activity
MALGNHRAPQTPRNDTGRLVLAGILLAIPVVALMAVPTYAHTDPTLWGFPFFFWYQFLWVFLCSGLTYAAYRLTLSARRKDGER